MWQPPASIPFTAKLARAGVYALLFLPLVYVKALYYPFTSPKAFFLIAVSELAIICYVWLVALHKQWRPRLHTVGKAFLVFIAVLFLASVFGVDPSQSFWGSAERDLNMIVWLHLAGVFVVSAGVFRTKEDWRRVFVISMCAAVVVAIVHILSLTGVSALTSTRNGSTLGNSSLFGTYILFQLFFSFFLIVTSTRKKQQWLWLCIFFVLAFALFSSTAIAATLAFLGGIVLTLGTHAMLQTKSRAIRVTISIVLTLAAALFVFFFLSTLVPESAARAWVASRTSGARFALLEIAWQAFKSRPFLGWGFENFSSAFFQFYNPCFGTPTCGGEFFFDRSHNIFLDVLVFSGLAGLITYLSVFAVYLRELWRAFQSRIISAKELAVLIGLIAAYVAQNLTVLDTVTSILFFAVLLAFVNAITGQKNEPRQTAQSPTTNYFVPVIATLAVPVMLFFFVVQPTRATVATRSVKFTSQMSERLPLYEKAVFLSPWGQEKRRTFLGAQTATVIWDLSPEKREQGRALMVKELSFAETGLLDSIATSPNLINSRLVLGFVYLTFGRYYDEQKYESARLVLSRATELSPDNPLPLWALAMVAFDQNENEEGLAFSKTALDLNTKVYASRARYLIAMRIAGEDASVIKSFAEELKTDFPANRSNIEAFETAELKTYRDNLLFKLFYDSAL